MNEQTIKLIEQLAAKLGTTAEHLWAVLVRQAQVAVWQNIFEIAMLSFLLYLYFKFTKYVFADEDKINEGGYVFVIAIGGIVAAIAIFMIIFSFEVILTCIGNPEYWALQKVLGTINSK